MKIRHFLLLSFGILLFLNVSAQNVSPEKLAARAILMNDEAALDSILLHSDLKLQQIHPFGTLLHLAAFSGNIRIAQKLRAHEISVNILDNKCRPPLFSALLRGHIELSEWLINSGADLEIFDQNGQTALLFLLDQGHDHVEELASMLLNHGADIHCLDHNGRGPLYYSILNRYESIGLKLLRMGVNHKQQIGQSDPNSLQYCGIYGLPQIAKELYTRFHSDFTEEDLKKTTLYAWKYGHTNVAEVFFDPNKIKSINMLVEKNPLDNTSFLGPSIHYLDTRGWLVSLSDRILIFDYEEGGNRPQQPSIRNGWIIQSEVDCKAVNTFYTCWHGYSDEPAPVHLLDLQHYSSAHFLNANDQFRGNKSFHYLDADTTLLQDGMRIQTFKSDEITQGYFLQHPSCSIIYTGFPDIKNVDHIIKKIKAKSSHVDILFVSNLNYKNEPEVNELWIRKWIDAFHPKYIIPKDCNGQELLSSIVAQKFDAYGQTNWFIPVYPGDRIHLDLGKESPGA